MELAVLLTWFGVLGVAVAALNAFALRVVHLEEVPRCAQGRIRWWGAHNLAFLWSSAALAVVGLGALIVS